MKSHYDNESNCRVFVCPVCSYVYHEYSDYSKQKMNTEQPFLLMTQPLLYEKPRDYAPAELLRVTHYACPKCGVLQIDLTDV